jgi:glucosylceramidase
MGPMQNWARGVIAWVLGTDNNDGPHISYSGACDSCRGLVTVDQASNSYTLQVDYYMMAQFSKFMPVGATVLSGSTVWSDTLSHVASLNPDGTTTVVIENKNGNDVYITLTTSSGQTWSGNAHANSVVTWVLPSHG